MPILSEHDHTGRGVHYEILRLGLQEFEKYVIGLGYEDFILTFDDAPRKTKHGMRYAHGSFVGPTPYTPGEERDTTETVHPYTFHVIEDVRSRQFIVEVYYETARIAVIALTNPKTRTLELCPLQGEIPEAW